MRACVPTLEARARCIRKLAFSTAHKVLRGYREDRMNAQDAIAQPRVDQRVEQTMRTIEAANDRFRCYVEGMEVNSRWDAIHSECLSSVKAENLTRVKYFEDGLKPTCADLIRNNCIEVKDNGGIRIGNIGAFIMSYKERPQTKFDNVENAWWMLQTDEKYQTADMIKYTGAYIWEPLEKLEAGQAQEKDLNEKNIDSVKDRLGDWMSLAREARGMHTKQRTVRRELQRRAVQIASSNDMDCDKYHGVISELPQKPDVRVVVSKDGSVQLNIGLIEEKPIFEKPYERELRKDKDRFSEILEKRKAQYKERKDEFAAIPATKPIVVRGGKKRRRTEKGKQVGKQVAKLREALPVYDVPQRSLWCATTEQRQLHHWDLFTYVGILAKTYEQHEAFWPTLHTLLMGAAAARWNYERVILTVQWMFGSKYWPKLAMNVINRGQHLLGEESWVESGKLESALITRYWVWPYSNMQHPAARWNLAKEDLIGYSKNLNTKKPAEAHILDVLQFKTEGMEYIFEDDVGDWTNEAYVRAFETQMDTFAQKLVASSRHNYMDFDDLFAQRTKFVQSGGAGAAMKDRYGKAKIPVGSTRKYAVSQLDRAEWDLYKQYTTIIEHALKADERKTERSILAPDTWDQVYESHTTQFTPQAYVNLGFDIGEDSFAEATRMLAFCRESGHFSEDIMEHIEAAFDYKKWDHGVTNFEQLCFLRQIFKATYPFVPDDRKGEYLEQYSIAMDKLHIQLVRLHIKDEELLKDFPDVRFMGNGLVEMKGAHGQDSGRYETLTGNTALQATRLFLRNLIAHKRGYRLPEHTSVRSDDVAEVFLHYDDAMACTEFLIIMGFQANPKKQVLSRTSIVYFKILYAMGSIGAMPARQTFSLCGRKPPKRSSGGLNPWEKLRNIAEACSRAVRRGWSADLMTRAYYEAEDYYSEYKTSFAWQHLPTELLAPAELKARSRARASNSADSEVVVEVLAHKMNRRCMRVQPLEGGPGLLPPGRGTYASGQCKMKRTVDYRRYEVEKKAMLRNEKAKPGSKDLMAFNKTKAEKQLQHDVPWQVVRDAKKKWDETLLGQNGTDKFAKLEVFRGAAQRYYAYEEFEEPRGAREVTAVAIYALRQYIRVLDKLIFEQETRLGVEANSEPLRTIFSIPGEGLGKHLWDGIAASLVGRGVYKNFYTLLQRTSEGKSVLEYFGEHFTRHRWGKELLEKWVTDGIGCAVDNSAFPQLGCSIMKWVIDKTMTEAVDDKPDSPRWRWTHRAVSKSAYEWIKSTHPNWILH